MPSNPTENIYSTEYEDSGTPIPSTKIGYDNTTSGLEATTVQGAIDELDNKIDTLNGVAVAYDGTESGLEATTVQGAIDEMMANGSEWANELGYTLDGSLHYIKNIGSETGMAGYGTALKTALDTLVAGLEDDEAITLLSVEGLVSNGSLRFANAWNEIVKKGHTFTTIMLTGNFLLSGGAELDVYNYCFNNYNHQTKFALTSAGVAVTQMDSDATAITNTQVVYLKWKKTSYVGE